MNVAEISDVINICPRAIYSLIENYKKSGTIERPKTPGPKPIVHLIAEQIDTVARELPCPSGNEIHQRILEIVPCSKSTTHSALKKAKWSLQKVEKVFRIVTLSSHSFLIFFTQNRSHILFKLLRYHLGAISPRQSSSDKSLHERSDS